MRLNQLLRTTAAAGQTESVGLRLSGEIHPDRLGLLGLILSHTATAGEAFEVVSRLSQLHNEALYLWTERDGGHLTARLEYMIHSATSVREIIEMTAGVIALNLRAIIGADWNPQLVCFRHAPPATTRFHRQVFRCPVRFATDVDGLVCLTRDFSRRNQLVGQGNVDFVREALARAARTTGDPMLRLTRTVHLGPAAGRELHHRQRRPPARRRPPYAASSSLPARGDVHDIARRCTHRTGDASRRPWAPNALRTSRRCLASDRSRTSRTGSFVTSACRRASGVSDSPWRRTGEIPFDDPLHPACRVDSSATCPLDRRLPPPTDGNEGLDVPRSPPERTRRACKRNPSAPDALDCATPDGPHEDLL